MADSRFPPLDFRTNLYELRHSKACWAWAAAIIGIQLLVSLSSEAVACDLYSLLGLSRERWSDGQMWRILTYGGLHGGFWHAGLNALFLLMVGHRIEHILGAAAVNRCILLGVFGGACFHLLVGSGLLIGLSGGCFALLVLLATISPQSRMFPLPLSGRSLAVGFMMASLLLALVHPKLQLPFFSEIGILLENRGLASWFDLGHACHFGGGLAGWFYGRWVLRPRITLESLRQQRMKRER